ncbi:hypothetical protein [Halobacterium rubrum]|uniref:hypothetical protein n=1 Tax=Halobacterium TaxID=2239 RepID=UPI001F244F35|nr:MULTISPECIES: hypothetical protein [Halobacterium]MDH5020400.1 hypothetical protein [Halobacterium rubrum]
MDAVRYGTGGSVVAGVGLTGVSGYALFGQPVGSPVVAAVLSLTVLAGVVVAGGGLLAATDRLPARTVVAAAVAPAGLGGATVGVVEGSAVARWIAVVMGTALACAVLGFVLVAATAGDGDRA